MAGGKNPKSSSWGDALVAMSDSSDSKSSFGRASGEICGGQDGDVSVKPVGDENFPAVILSDSQEPHAAVGDRPKARSLRPAWSRIWLQSLLLILSVCLVGHIVKVNVVDVLLNNQCSRRAEEPDLITNNGIRLEEYICNANDSDSLEVLVRWFDLQNKWRSYRVQDAINGQYSPNFYEQFGVSIVSEYYSKTNLPNQMEILYQTIKPRLIDKLTHSNTAVMHVRLDDTAVEGVWEAPHFLRLLTNEIILVFSTYDIEIEAVEANAMWGVKYVKQLEQSLSRSGFKVVKRVDCGTADEDFVFMASSRIFIQGGGGYSKLVATMVKMNGGEVLHAQKYLHQLTAQLRKEPDETAANTEEEKDETLLASKLLVSPVLPPIIVQVGPGRTATTLQFQTICAMVVQIVKRSKSVSCSFKRFNPNAINVIKSHRWDKLLDIMPPDAQPWIFLTSDIENGTGAPSISGPGVIKSIVDKSDVVRFGVESVTRRYQFIFDLTSQGMDDVMDYIQHWDKLRICCGMQMSADYRRSLHLSEPYVACENSAEHEQMLIKTHLFKKNDMLKKVSNVDGDLDGSYCSTCDQNIRLKKLNFNQKCV
jgi:hypothetical protein